MPGLPVPFNKLRTVILKLFWLDLSGGYFAKVLDIHLHQGAYVPRHKQESWAARLMVCEVPFRAFWVRFTPAAQKKNELSSYSRLAFETWRALWAIQSHAHSWKISVNRVNPVA
jgi:hypothetical protein